MTKILRHSRYNPGRGGHAPGDLRDAFCDAVEAMGQWTSSEPLPTIEIREQIVSIDNAFRLLWNCVDVLPHLLVTEVNELLQLHDRTELKRSSYSAASRALLAVCDAGA